MITIDYDYENGRKKYNAGDIIRVKGAPGEEEKLGIVAHSWEDGSHCVITPDGFIGLAERVVSEPTGRSFDLFPLFDKLRAGDFKVTTSEDAPRIGDIVLNPENEPGIVFYIFEKNGDVAVLFTDGMSLGSSPGRYRYTGEFFDLSPMYSAIRG